MTQFKKKYQNLGSLVSKTKCYVCHASKNKKKRNDYGKALKKIIGKKNEKDIKKIIAALDKVAKEKSSVKGKTFGDLIKEGKLPGKKTKK